MTLVIEHHFLTFSKRVKMDVKDIQHKIRDFNDLLSEIDNLTDKKKQLWKEIYENALTDRHHAYTVYMSLINIVGDKSSEHAVHGRSLATFIERMSKANDQLLKLADLISKAESKNDEFDPDDMYKQINKK